MASKKNLFLGIGVLIIAVLDIIGALSLIGITHRFVDIVFIFLALWLIVYSIIK